MASPENVNDDRYITYTILPGNRATAQREEGERVQLLSGFLVYWYFMLRYTASLMQCVVAQGYREPLLK